MDVQGITIMMFTMENVQNSVEALLALLPKELQREGIVQQQQARGFNEQVITILAITITRKKDVRLLVDELLSKLVRYPLIRQLASRVDDNLNFFVRIDKASWMQKRVARLVDHGNCIHIKFSLVTYPRNREAALKGMKRLLEAKGF